MSLSIVRSRRLSLIQVLNCYNFDQCTAVSERSQVSWIVFLFLFVSKKSTIMKNGKTFTNSKKLRNALCMSKSKGIPGSDTNWQ